MHSAAKRQTVDSLYNKVVDKVVSKVVGTDSIRNLWGIAPTSGSPLATFICRKKSPWVVTTTVTSTTTVRDSTRSRPPPGGPPGPCRALDSIVSEMARR